MTAIAGCWSFGDGPAPLPSCTRMLKAQQIYAPDRPTFWNDGEVAFGRRLFATLPEDVYDTAPVTGGGGRWVLFGDVRLDNRDELGAALGITPGEASRLSDTELVMRAVERWQEPAFEHLIGDFAIAIWDADRRRILLARDFMGTRPLHYHRGNGFFAFASMPKGLHALPEVPFRPDLGAVSEFLALLPETGRASFYEGVERVEPGHLAVVTGDGVRSRPFWRFSAPELRLRRDEDYEEALREAFDRAVAARLRGAGGQVAAHLSGGLDSSSVAATAARLLAPTGGEVVAYTAAPREDHDGALPPNRFGDESDHAAAVANLHANMRHVVVRTNSETPVANLDRNIFLYDRPVLNLCNSVWADAIMDRAKQAGHKVLLTGVSGNLSISYTGLPLLPELLRRGRVLPLLQQAISLRRNGMSLKSFAANTLGPLLPARLRTAVARLRGREQDFRKYTALRSDQSEALRQQAQARRVDLSDRPSLDSTALRLSALGRVDQSLYHKGRLGGWGIDVRDPTGDRRLVELCLSIPLDQYLRAGHTRSLARRAFADRLPALVTGERRRGYQAANWHEGVAASRDRIAEEVERVAAVPAAADILDIQTMRNRLSEWPEGKEWGTPDIELKYRLALLRGVSAGHFIRKASGAN